MVCGKKTLDPRQAHAGMTFFLRGDEGYGCAGMAFMARG